MQSVTLPHGKLPRALLAAGLIAAVLVVVAGFLFVTGAFQQDPETLLRQHGGYRITLQAHCPSSLAGCDVGALLPALSDTLTSRIHDGLGITAAQVRQQGDTQVVVYLPSIADSTAAVTLLSAPGLVQFIDTGFQQINVGSNIAGETCTSSCTSGHFAVLFDGSELDPNSVAAKRDPQSGQPIVSFAFAGTARDRFAQYTQSHIGEYLTIVLDGRVIESAVIQSEIGGAGEIGPGLTGSLSTMADAQRLAAFLKDGALPLAVTVVTVTHVAQGSGG